MSNEKLRILEMIKDGTVTPQEGLDLLNALGESEISITNGSGIKLLPDATDQNTSSNGKSSKRPRHIYIQVEKPDGGKVVNIRMPIGLAKFASKFIPKDAKAEMREQGIDLDINGVIDELCCEGPQTLVDINDEEEGKKVRIYVE